MSQVESSERFIIDLVQTGSEGPWLRQVLEGPSPVRPAGQVVVTEEGEILPWMVSNILSNIVSNMVNKMASNMVSNTLSMVGNMESNILSIILST